MGRRKTIFCSFTVRLRPIVLNDPTTSKPHLSRYFEYKCSHLLIDSGHGIQVADQNGDEADGLDEGMSRGSPAPNSESCS